MHSLNVTTLAWGLPAPRLGNPYREERALAAQLNRYLKSRRDLLDSSRADAKRWIEAIRARSQPPFAVERLLSQFPISTREGLALLRLAEALLRIPDVDTAALLATDIFKPIELTPSEDEDLFATATRNAMRLGQRLLPETDSELATSLLARLGARTFVGASRAAVGLLSHQFVFADNVDHAIENALKLDAGGRNPTVSFDMLGEGARTAGQAARYLFAYQQIIERTATLPRDATEPYRGASVSIKLTALHPRFEETHRQPALSELMDVLTPLITSALDKCVPVTIDAEESERLELHLDVMDQLFRTLKPPPAMLGLALQAYGLRAFDAIDALAELALSTNTTIAVRLVKGAYWDSEIKRAQELGLPGYTVFTHKSHTDLSYLACASKLLEQDCFYPMFATHNAATLAAVQALARGHTDYEFQRLHGMGASLYDVAADDLSVPVRIYAPVGEPRDLLAYLVRRLLENGANTSFVHQLNDPQVAPEKLTVLPVTVHRTTALPLPAALYGVERPNSRGVDLSQRYENYRLQSSLHTLAQPNERTASEALHEVFSPVDGRVVGAIAFASLADVDAAYQRAHAAWIDWERRSVIERAHCLRRAADALESKMEAFLPLLAREAGKTLIDGMAEVREAVDFLRYYAAQAETLITAVSLPGPTGEENTLQLRGRGVWNCISPWNFPLAIFTGQVAAALVTGNCVLAKPAEQTPLVAERMVALLHEAGVPSDVLIMLAGAGDIGAALTRHPQCAGVAFTGSTEVARLIAQSLASRNAPLVPLIAETGGINAMVVDSTALPEQVIDAVITSGARSAGQRCSALRLLCVQEDIADELIAGIAGALEVLRVGDPLDPSTDVGPIIDRAALLRLQDYERELANRGRFIARAPLEGQPSDGQYFAPCAYEVTQIEDVNEEVFGPILQIVRYRAKDLDQVLEAINALGFGLTLGIQTRIAGRARQIAAKLRVGNVYVNRSMIGAVVGVQPFGGQGLSGTGPKAGGPHYLARFVTEQTVTINTAAAGGNATLLASIGADAQ